MAITPGTRIEQRRPDGSLRHLITLEDLRRSEIESLLERAQTYVGPIGQRPPSSRRLGAEVVNLEVQLSSRVKGETMLDTIFTLQALHFDVFVIRDAEPGVLAHVAANVAPHVSVLSAGEAHLSHPTQGLLDALTIRQFKGPVSEQSIAIVGDIRHSRVARSAYQIFRALEAREVRIVAPPALMPEAGEFAGASRFETLEEGLAGVDVVMMLRVQKERFAQTDLPDGDEYFARYGLDAQRLRRASPSAIVMHPQPMNRGIEIDSAVADGPQSVIRAQVSNGVAVRMAVLETVAGGMAA